MNAYEAGEHRESYDIATLNDALDEFGMLSSITQSRKEYIQENENANKLKCVNMSGERAGPSWVSDAELPVKKFLFNVPNNPNDNDLKYSLCDFKEKENKAFENLHILTMNSQFITSFKTGYSFPLNDFTESSNRKVFRCNVMRKRKWRSHPYEKKTYVKVENFISSNNDTLSELDQAACRLRTTSLSSGTSNSRRVALERYKTVEATNSGLKRSRSMENLRGSKENPPFTDCDKTRDIETVSKGIQEMQMEDCT